MNNFDFEKSIEQFENSPTVPFEIPKQYKKFFEEEYKDIKNIKKKYVNKKENNQ